MEINHPGAGGSRFADFLDQSLQRFSKNGVSVEELRVSLDQSPSRETLKAVSRWIRFASATNLRALSLCVSYQCGRNPLVPVDPLSSGTLTSLYLSGFKLTTLGPDRSWRMPRLRSLSLSSILLDSAVLNELEEFKLDRT